MNTSTFNGYEIRIGYISTVTFDLGEAYRLYNDSVELAKTEKGLKVTLSALHNNESMSEILACYGFANCEDDE